MKDRYTTLLLIAGLGLQGCASVIDAKKGEGNQTTLKGSTALSYTAEQCPMGMGMIRLYKDTKDGNKTKYNAKFGMTSEPITGGINAYSLIGEAEASKDAKASVATDYNSVIVELSEVPADEARSNSAARLNEPISIRYNAEKGYYQNWGDVDEAVLSGDKTKTARPIIQSVSVQFGDFSELYSVPDTIDPYTGPSQASADNAEEKKEPAFRLDKKLSAEAGGMLVLKLKSKVNMRPGNIIVQLYNGKKGAEAQTYKYIIPEKEGTPLPPEGLSIELKDEKDAAIADGEYDLIAFRSEMTPHPVASAEGKAFCMEVGTGFMGKLSVTKPKAK